MKNSIGTSVILTLFGESHGDSVGAVLDGMAPGVTVDEGFISSLLAKRSQSGELSTARRETDEFRIISGVRGGLTTGTPVCIVIPNRDVRSADYEKLSAAARPGHADYTAQCKYHGFQDVRGGGHFSGRITAALVAAGGIALSALGSVGITVGTHIYSLAGIPDRPFNACDPSDDLALLESRGFPVLDPEASEKMRGAIIAARKDGDSVGGVLETAVTGIPAGVGEPWFDTVEGVLSHMLFSVPAVKGVEFGDGFRLSDMRGSIANDPILPGGATETNRNGGINGGITNGMPLIFRTAVKPTPSISLPQRTVDMRTGLAAELRVTGRHDPAIVHRACIVATCASACALCDLLALRYGTDWPRIVGG